MTHWFIWKHQQAVLPTPDTVHRLKLVEFHHPPTTKPTLRRPYQENFRFGWQQYRIRPHVPRSNEDSGAPRPVPETHTKQRPQLESCGVSPPLGSKRRNTHCCNLKKKKSTFYGRVSTVWIDMFAWRNYYNSFLGFCEKSPAWWKSCRHCDAFFCNFCNYWSFTIIKKNYKTTIKINPDKEKDLRLRRKQF